MSSDENSRDDPAIIIIRDWVPPSVATAMQNVWSRLGSYCHLPEVQRFRRLVEDERMREIWHTLQTRSQKGGYQYPGFSFDAAVASAEASGLGYEPPDENEQQGKAMAEWFTLIAAYAACEPTVTTRKEIEAERQRLLDFLQLVERLRQSIEELPPTGPELLRFSIDLHQSLN